MDLFAWERSAWSWKWRAGDVPGDLPQAEDAPAGRWRVLHSGGHIYCERHTHPTQAFASTLAPEVGAWSGVYVHVAAGFVIYAGRCRSTLARAQQHGAHKWDPLRRVMLAARCPPQQAPMLESALMVFFRPTENRARPEVPMSRGQAFATLRAAKIIGDEAA